MILWLASFPRSGNTFIRIVLKQVFGLETRSIYNDTRDIGADPSLGEMTGHVVLGSDFDWDFARRSEEIFVIKTHELCGGEHVNDKAIVLIRDGRDATVSFFNHQIKFGTQVGIRDIIDGKPLGFTWAQHEESWRDSVDASANRLFLKFEEFTQDVVPSIEAIANFFDFDAHEVRLPQFEKLHQTSPEFFRKGKSGYYGDLMDTNLQRYFWVVNGQRMEANGYEKHLSNDPEADQRMFFDYFMKNISAAGRNIQNLMRENGCRMGAIDQLFAGLGECKELTRKQEELFSVIEDRLLGLSMEVTERLKKQVAVLESLKSVQADNAKILSSHVASLEALEARLKSVHAEIGDRLGAQGAALEALEVRLKSVQAETAEGLGAQRSALEALEARLESVRTEAAERFATQAATLETFWEKLQVSEEESAERSREQSAALEILKHSCEGLEARLVASNLDIAKLKNENHMRIEGICLLEERIKLLESKTLPALWRRFVSKFKIQSTPDI